MSRIALALVAAVIVLTDSSAQAKPPRLDGYKGADAGHLVMSLTAENGAQAYLLALSYRRVGESLPAYVRFQFATGAIFNLRIDFGNDAFPKVGLNPQLMIQTLDENKHVDEGVVFVEDLAPGTYEIFDAEGSTAYVGRMYRTFRLTSPTSIRFEIKPGQTTYIGEFKALPIYSKGVLGTRESAGVRYVVTDQGSRDLPIAIRKNPSIGTAQTAVPDVDSLNSPLFSSKP
jgi:hypothetical protein